MVIHIVLDQLSSLNSFHSFKWHFYTKFIYSHNCRLTQRVILKIKIKRCLRMLGFNKIDVKMQYYMRNYSYTIFIYQTMP